MYLSRIEINPQRIETRRALASPQIMHAALESSFPSAADSKERRNLWRVDKLGNSLYILLQSFQKPDFTHIVEQFGWIASEQVWETKDYGPFISRLKPGQAWHFRLRANPVRSVKIMDGSQSRGKVVHHITVEQQKKWLYDRSLKCGFAVINDNKNDLPEHHQYSFDVVQSDLLSFKRLGEKVTISLVTFEGVLKITDGEIFVQSMIKGIGRAKAYGCGLLTLARA